MDRNRPLHRRQQIVSRSLSVRRAWIEILRGLPKEHLKQFVALRKESVDRNLLVPERHLDGIVALRKESVDRNIIMPISYLDALESLSVRRAWIEI